jgi:hypothetical protein
VPFTAFRLTFNGGSKALLVTPRACGAAQAQAQLTPWSSSTPVARNSTVTISWDGAGAPCPSPRPFNPTLALTLSDSSAGASPAMTLTVTRPDRDQELGSLRVSLPPGLLGYLAMDGLSLCSPASAASGSCPASSRVGSVAATSGPGTSPVTLNGDVYLTSAPRSGAIAGLAVVIPARVGPVDLGRVVVTNALVLRLRAGRRERPAAVGAQGDSARGPLARDQARPQRLPAQPDALWHSASGRDDRRQ